MATRRTALALGASLLALAAASPAAARFCPPRSDNNGTYDYIVVGSGPGGGPIASNLARAGYSVLLVEAGDDQSNNYNSAIPTFFPFGYTDTSLRWDFFVRNYDDESRTLRNNHLTWLRADGSYYVGSDPPSNATLLGLYYPRGGTLGGSSAVNAMGAVLPSDSDWQNVADLTGDSSWSPSHMRQIFVRIENNHYLTAGTPGHGFEGYFDTNQGGESIWAGQDDLLAVLGTVSEGLGQDPDDLVENLVADVNFLSSTRDQSQGVFGSALHVDAMWRRFSSRDYVLDTAGATDGNGDQKYPLYVQLNTLATKVRFEDTTSNQPRKAIGVELLQGQSMYSADPRYDPTDGGVLVHAYARKEVILAGGAFNSPQLLKLSGIGPAAELAQLDIPLVVDLPGVGTNLQDNYEVPIVGHAAANFTGPPPNPNDPICTFGAPGDPCIPLWEQGEGPYTGSMGSLNAIFRKSAYPAVNERDVFMAGGTFAIHGFWPPTDSVPADPPNTFALSTVKIHPQSHSGRVLLKSSNPRDTPDINFHLFESNDGGTAMDLNAELDTIKWARRTFADVPGPIGPIEPIEPPCATTPAFDGSCDDEADKEWVMDQIFGHHCTSTCAIGADDDGMAVLDSKFRVRGVSGLRVVDASAFPRTPGPFPVLPTFMLSEKATESVLEDANSW